MQAAFANLPRSSYPFTVSFFRASSPLDINPVYEVTVDGPGALFIPPLAKLAGEPVRIVVAYADGTVERDEDY